MNLKEAENLAYKTKWKVKYCPRGIGCWCREIHPVKKIQYEVTYLDTREVDVYEYNIIQSACVDRKLAKYIVKLHNQEVERCENV